MLSVPDFLFQAFILICPALIAAGGGFIAYCSHNSKKLAHSITFLTAATLLGLGLAIERSGFQSWLWAAPVFIGAMMLLQLASSSAFFAALGRRLVAAHTVHGSQLRVSYVLMALCPLFLAGGLWQINVMASPEEISFEGLQEFQPVVLVEMTGLSVYTDHGQKVPLFKPSAESAATIAISGNQGLPVNDTPLPYRAIRQTEPDVVSNCTGWVFAGAQAWIQCRDVQAILDDNGYQPVKSVRAGDLVIYRDTANVITHAGCVVARLEDGRPLIQSKWGHQGVFLHLPNGTPYGDNWSFYHSSRSGHQLASLPSGDSSNRVATEVAP
jgi:hypothetical protein